MEEERGRKGGMAMLYHEEQESKLCAVHCVNTVLQGPFFSEFDLAAMASDLDHTENQMISLSHDGPHHLSHNVSLQGDFSIQVLQRAMEVWDLQVIPLNSPVAEPALNNPDAENGYICHSEDHWFSIRKVSGEWYNFDSILPAPQHLSKFYLSAYLDSLKGCGWSIFLVRGNFPSDCPLASSEASNGYGKWLTPEEAERINKSYANSTPPTRRAQSDQFDDRGDPKRLREMEEEDLKAAIAASLMDSSSSMANKEADNPSTNFEVSTQGDHSPAKANTESKSQTDPSPAIANTGAKSQLDSDQGTTIISTENLNDSPSGPAKTDDKTPEKADQL